MIYLTQWLCADRHCSIGFAWDDQVDSKDAMVKRGEALYRTVVNRWCGLCGGELHPEHRRTPFTTMEAVMPLLEELELSNTLARGLFGEC